MRRSYRLRFRTATTRKTFDTRPIGDQEPGSAVVDQVPFSQTLSNARNTRPVNAQDPRHVFVRDPKFISLASAMESEQPAAKSLFNRMKGIADDALRELFDLRVDVIMKRYLETGVSMYLAFEQISTYDKSGAGDTDLHAVRSATRIERGGDANGTFAPDNTNLDHSSVFEDLEFRYDRCLRKEDVVDPVILLI
jgi:hypothetical protein